MKFTKSQLKEIIKEAASEYIWGIKNPSRVANQYRISTLNLKRLIHEEVSKLLEQPDLAAASHAPDVSAPGGGMLRADAREIDKLDRDIKGWTKIREEILDKAYELGADPQLIDYFNGDFDQLMTAMMDMLYQQYQMEQPAGAA
tara:strand:+ start:815 stop:1246 length:432 start_codon:yes stop_codon:yes gene_type:complete